MAANNYFGFAAGTPYVSTSDPNSYTTGQSFPNYPVPHPAQTYSAAPYPYATTQHLAYDKAQSYYQAQVAYTTNAQDNFQNPSIYVQPSNIAQTIDQSAINQNQIQESTMASASTPKVPAYTWMNTFNMGPASLKRPKLIRKPQQYLYCDICKVSCACARTYKEHQEGQKHKKKESALNAGAVPLGRAGKSYHCELCNISCSGFDAYSSHIRGTKHQKVLKLYTKLGKPIPPSEPQIISANGSKITSTNAESLQGNIADNENIETANNSNNQEVINIECSNASKEKKILPVGQDYIEEIQNKEGKVTSFRCKLCDCVIHDTNTKDVHMKGRKHRIQYKRKVDPHFVVDIKPILRRRRFQDEKRNNFGNDIEKWRYESRWRNEMNMMEDEWRMYWEERRHYEDECFEWHKFNYYSRMPRTYENRRANKNFRNIFERETIDDRHVMAKYKQIYPKEEKLDAIKNIIMNCEKALKLVSDFLTKTEDVSSNLNAETKSVHCDTLKPSNIKDENSKMKETDPTGQQYRVLKGVMRVGNIAKGLVLTDDRTVQLVVVCAEKPTCKLLKQVIETLPKQFEAVVPEEKYEIKADVKNAAIVISTIVEPKIDVVITLTSLAMRDLNNTKETESAEVIADPPDILNKEKCLEALAALRHIKWFEAKITPLQSCVIVLYVLQDLCRRIPVWKPLNSWAMELLVEKVLCSAGYPLSPSDALKRVLESIASGIILPGSSVLLDPCEKDPSDVTANFTNQEREDLTASAQMALRLIAFRQIHKVLDIEPLPLESSYRLNRKRRCEDNDESVDDNEKQNEKKDKKEK